MIITTLCNPCRLCLAVFVCVGQSFSGCRGHWNWCQSKTKWHLNLEIAILSSQGWALKELYHTVNLLSDPYKISPAYDDRKSLVGFVAGRVGQQAKHCVVLSGDVRPCVGWEHLCGCWFQGGIIRWANATRRGWKSVQSQLFRPSTGWMEQSHVSTRHIRFKREIISQITHRHTHTKLCVRVIKVYMGCFKLWDFFSNKSWCHLAVI